MNNLAKFFPLSARFSNTGGELAIGIIIYMAASILLGIISGIITFVLTLIFMPLGLIVAFILGLIGTLVSIYCLAGIVIEILMFAKVIK